MSLERSHYSLPENQLSLVDPYYNAHEAANWPAPEVDRTLVAGSALARLLNETEADDTNFKRFTGEAVSFIEASLRDMGVVVDAPSESDLQTMHERAEQCVESGQTEEFLNKLPFRSMRAVYASLDDPSVIKSVVSWNGDTIYIDSDRITSGGSNFICWSGNPSDPRKSRTTADRKWVDGTSLKAIEEYAARYDTQLPKLEATALNIILKKDGVMCAVDHSVHRTAAAKLRGEPLRFSSFVFYDAREL